MADVLKYDEGIVLPDGYKSPSEMLPQSVVFIFNDNTIPPISCNLDYLYAFTHEKSEKAILLLCTSNLENLTNILKENDVIIVPADEVYNL